MQNIEKNSSTKEMVIQNAIELINEVGIVDFRIDDLASRLSLSPGNITYHFSKKDEIYNSIWSRLCNEMLSLNIFITKIVDIKQLFIYVKIMMNTIYRYRGIVMYSCSDVSNFSDKAAVKDSFVEIVEQEFGFINKQLINNGLFVVKDGDSQYQYAVNIAVKMILLWINRVVLLGGLANRTISFTINKEALAVIYNFKMFFSGDALLQYNELVDAVENNKIDFV